MTNKEAIEHAKALKMLCKETRCGDCPFGKKTDSGEIALCRLVDYGDIPYGWELEENE